MRHHIGLYPQPGDEPHAYMGGSAEDIPVLELDGRAQLAFHLDLDAAVAYLDHLADEASSLAAKIRRQQQDARRVSIHPGERCWFHISSPTCAWNGCDEQNPNYDSERNPDPQYRGGTIEPVSP